MSTPVDILIRARDEFSAVVNKAQAEITALAKSNVELGNATVKVSSEAGKAGAAFNTLQRGAHQSHQSFVEARESAQALGEQIGVHLPRYVSSFLARSSLIGPALSAAFSGLAVVGLIGVILELPEAFKKLEGAITGWSEKAKKAYEGFIEDNKKAIDQVNDLAAAQARIKAPTGELGDIAAIQKRLELGKEELAQQTRRAVLLREQSMELIRQSGAGQLRLGGQTAGDLKKQAEEIEKANVARAANIRTLENQLKELQETMKQKPSREFGEALKDLDDTFQKTQISSSALAAAVNNAVASGKSSAQIIAAFGKAMEDQEEQAMRAGTAINNAFLPFLEIMFRQKEAIAINKELDKSIEQMRADIDAESNAFQSAAFATEQYNEMLKQVPLANTEVARQFATMLDLVERQEEQLQKLTPLYNNLATTIQHFPPLPGTGLQSPALQAPIIQGEAHIMGPEDWAAFRKRGQEVIDSIADDIGRMFTDSISHGKNFWDAFKRLGLDAIASINSFLIKSLIKGALSPFEIGLGRITQGIGAKLAGVLSGGLLGGAGGIGATAAAPLVSTIGTASVINQGAITGGVVAAPGAFGGGISGALGLGGGAGLLGLGAATIPVIGAAVLGIYGLFKLFSRKTMEAPFTRDPNIEGERTIFFYAANQLADAAKQLQAAGRKLGGISFNDSAKALSVASQSLSNTGLSIASKDLVRAAANVAAANHLSASSLKDATTSQAVTSAGLMQASRQLTRAADTTMNISRVNTAGLKDMAASITDAARMQKEFNVQFPSREFRDSLTAAAKTLAQVNERSGDDAMMSAANDLVLAANRFDPTILADAASGLASATYRMNTMPAGQVVIQGLPAALQTSNQFRRNTNAVLQDDI